MVCYIKSKALIKYKLENGTLIYNKIYKNSCALGIKESHVLELCDGTNSVEEICAKADIFENDLMELIQVFKENHLLEDTPSINKKKKLFFAKKGVLYGDAWLKVPKRKIERIIIRFLVLLMYIALIISIVIFNGTVDTVSILNSLRWYHILYADMILSVSVAIHELAHAFVAKTEGGHIGEIGLTIDILVPIAYTTLCGLNNIKSKTGKISIYAAGLSVNAAISTFALVMLQFINNIFIFIVFAVNLCLIIVNSFTFLRTDGYRILEIITKTNDLRERSLNWVKTHKSETIRQKFIYIIYLILSFVIEPILIILLIYFALIKGGVF